jgi:hypothetical protein
MRRVFVLLMIIAGIMISTDMAAQAKQGKTADDNKTTQTMQQKAGSNYIDSNGDGICDNRPGRSKGDKRNFIDNDGNGICDNFKVQGAGGQGSNFTDNNNDGICDNSKNGRQGNGFGNGRCQCRGNGNGQKNRRGQR